MKIGRPGRPALEGVVGYDLPANRIAQHPADRRENARLLVLNRKDGGIEDRKFTDLPQILNPQDLLILNDTKVMPARMLGVLDDGSPAELLFVRRSDDSGRPESPRQAWCMAWPMKKLGLGAKIRLKKSAATVLEYRDRLLRVEFSSDPEKILRDEGHVPLPPYIRRHDEPPDRERYQTVYARHPGSVAAPTAGLHFTDKIFAALEKRGVRTAFVQLHIGPGTFRPIYDSLDSHRMDPEWGCLPKETVEAARDARKSGGRVIAVGTSVTRLLESRGGEPCRGWVDIFIRPGHEFKSVDAMVTNFHQPRSAPLTMTSAFAGCAALAEAYRHALAGGYRFLSYGDAMLII